MFTGFAKFIVGWVDPEGFFWAPDDLTYCRPKGSNLEMSSHLLRPPVEFQFVPENVVQPIDLRVGQTVIMMHASDKATYQEHVGQKFKIDIFDLYGDNRPWVVALNVVPGEKDSEGSKGKRWLGCGCYISRLWMAEDQVVAAPHKCTCDNFVLFAKGCQCGGV